MGWGARFGESHCNFILKLSQPEDIKPMSQRDLLSEWISDFFHSERDEGVASFCRQFRRNVLIFCFWSSLCSVHLLSRVWLFVTLWTAALQASCPSPTPRVYSNSCPLSQWCHPTISLSVIPFSSLLQSLPASGSFQMSPLFTSGGQSIGVPASASVLPMNIQDWFPFDWLVGSPCSPRDSQESSPSHSSKGSILWMFTFLYSSTLTPFMATGKTVALTRWTFVDKIMLFNMLSRLVITFLPRS